MTDTRGTERSIVDRCPPDGLHGRRKIFSDRRKITAENVVEELGKALAIHRMNVAEIDYLYGVYRGIQDIREKEYTKKVRPDVNNIVMVNRANEIVTFKVAYLLEGPIQYTSTGGDEGTSEQVRQLNSFMLAEDKPSLDKEVMDWMSIAGVGARMVVSDEEREPNGSPLAIYTIPPREGFVIYSSYVGNKPLAGVLCLRDEDGQPKHCVYTTEYMWDIQGGTIVREERRTLNYIPIIEYPANGARMGAFEVVLPLLNAINVIESNRVDSIQDFVNAYDVFQNCEVDDDTYKTLTSGGQAISIKSIPGAGEAKVYRISSILDQSNVQTLIDDLYDEALTICGMPNRNGGSSTSDTGQASIFRDGWQSAESRAKDTETIFDRSERQFLKACLTICNATGDLTLSVSDINIEHTRNNLSNMQSRMQILCEGLANDKIHPKLPWVFAGMPNAEENYRISMQYYEEEQAKLAEELEEEMKNERASVSSSGQGDEGDDQNGGGSVSEKTSKSE